MRALLIAFTLWLGLTFQAAAQDTEIQGVIGDQIEAFKADDFATAFTYASPSIQGIFRTPENFGRMVSQGYPMVWRPADVKFLDLREQAGSLWQRVMITDGKGAVHLLDYRMLQTENGWKINGVQILKSDELSA